MIFEILNPEDLKFITFFEGVVNKYQETKKRFIKSV